MSTRDNPREQQNKTLLKLIATMSDEALSHSIDVLSNGKLFQTIELMTDELLTVDETCQLLKVSRAQVYKLTERGLPYIQLGKSKRFSRCETMRYASQFKHNGIS